MKQPELFEPSPLHSEPAAILSAETYPEFAEALRASNCQLCELCKGRTQIVVDRGDYRAKIMVIGEAPGRNEDLQGKAFIGRGGQLFDKIMASVGIDTNRDTLICNVNKCRPPDNRAPRPEEAEACRPYLMKQIALVKPSVILLLGATALKHIDPSRKKFPMEQNVGQFFELPEFPNIRFMVFYHPAALLYNSKLKPVTVEHAKKLKSFLIERFQTA